MVFVHAHDSGSKHTSTTIMMLFKMSNNSRARCIEFVIALLNHISLNSTKLNWERERWRLGWLGWYANESAQCALNSKEIIMSCECVSARINTHACLPACRSLIADCVPYFTIRIHGCIFFCFQTQKFSTTIAKWLIVPCLVESMRSLSLSRSLAQWQLSKIYFWHDYRIVSMSMLKVDEKSRIMPHIPIQNANVSFFCIASYRIAMILLCTNCTKSNVPNRSESSIHKMVSGSQSASQPLTHRCTHWNINEILKLNICCFSVTTKTKQKKTLSHTRLPTQPQS